MNITYVAFAISSSLYSEKDRNFSTASANLFC